MKNQLIKILVPETRKGKKATFEKIKVTMETIQRNFEISEAREDYLRTIGQGGQRGYESLDEYCEQLKKGKAVLYNRFLGTYRPVLILPDNEQHIRAIKWYCNENDISFTSCFVKI